MTGRELYFRTGRELMAVRVELGSEFRFEKPVPLFRDAFDPGGEGHVTYDVGPDGRFLFVVRPGDSPEEPYAGLTRYQVVLNWDQEVAERVPRP